MLLLNNKILHFNYQIKKKACSFLLYIVLINCLNITLSQDLRFQKFKTNDGLSNSYINCIIQDPVGFIWIGTNDGLNKFDGYNFKVYRHNYNDSLTISSNIIYCLEIDSQGRLIVGTQNGIDVYHEKKDCFKPINWDNSSGKPINRMITDFFPDSNKLWIASPGIDLTLLNLNTFKDTVFRILKTNQDKKKPFSINKIHVGSHKKIWLATNSGLFQFDKENGETRQFVHDDNNFNTISNDRILTITEDALGNIWAGTENGLNKYDREKGIFIRYYHLENNPNSLSNNRILSSYKDKKGTIWIGTASGLNKFDHAKEIFISYYKDDRETSSLINDRISSIYVDNQGNLWVGNRDGGLNLNYAEHKEFTHHKFYPTVNEKVSYNDFTNVVTSLIKDKNGNYWIGTNGSGLIYFNPKKQSRKNFLTSSLSPDNQGAAAILALLEDYEGNIWIGTYSNGLILYNIKTKKFTFFRHEETDTTTISGNDVRALCEVGDSAIFIGTNNRGLNVYNKDKKKFKRFALPSDSKHVLLANSINEIKQEDSSNFWIATVWGLYKLNIVNNNIEHYIHQQNNNNTINHNFVNCVHIDKNNRIWIGTRGGVNIYYPDKSTFYPITVNDGLPNNNIQGILQDKYENFWLSTNNGLSKIKTFNDSTIEKKNLNLTNYDESDGIQGNEFLPGSYHYDLKSGEILFGGNNGFTAFYPENINNNPFKPKVVFTDFYIFNKKINYKDNNSVLKNHINYSDKIFLNYKDRIFSIEFTALNFINSKKNKYKYKLEGFNNNWINNGNEKKVTFTNLDPGDYVFRVKASNNDGIWSNHEASIAISIEPPFWRTWWAYMSYILFILIILYILRKDITEREKLNKVVEIEKIEIEKMQEMDQLKSKFFMNISHELRTPLNLIINPLHKILTKHKIDQELENELKIIKRNANRLLTLLNQILDFRKLELGRLKLEVENKDIVGFVKNITLSFENRAKNHDIDYAFHSDAGYLSIWFDKDKLEKIIYNLLSNAFKFTPEHGQVSVQVDLSNDDYDNSWYFPQENARGLIADTETFCKIIIKDSGAGIAENKIQYIFNRFFQAGTNSNQLTGGTGIGLSLVKELADLHRIIIIVKSTLNKGTEFHLLLPLGKSYYNPDEISIRENNNEVQAIMEDREEEDFTGYTGPSEKSALKVLIIDDDDETCLYLRNELKNSYQVYTACNGTEGFKQALKIKPDIILSDIMMPGIDGILLCDKFKTDLNTSHIPIILVTAKNDETSTIEGLRSGADDYISKPFNIEILKARVKGLIDNRKKLQKLFSKDFDFTAEDITCNPADNDFLKRAIEITKDKIMDNEFSSTEFASIIGVSRSLLFVKIKVLTGMTVNEFIKNIRLKKAAELLLENKYTISEIVFETGFNNRSYFTRCFKEQFGMSPSEFKLQKQGNN